MQERGVRLDPRPQGEWLALRFRLHRREAQTRPFPAGEASKSLTRDYRGNLMETLAAPFPGPARRPGHKPLVVQHLQSRRKNRSSRSTNPQRALHLRFASVARRRRERFDAKCRNFPHPVGFLDGTRGKYATLQQVRGAAGGVLLRGVRQPCDIRKWPISCMGTGRVRDVPKSHGFGKLGGRDQVFPSVLTRYMWVRTGTLPFPKQ